MSALLRAWGQLLRDHAAMEGVSLSRTIADGMLGMFACLVLVMDAVLLAVAGGLL